MPMMKILVSANFDDNPRIRDNQATEDSEIYYQKVPDGLPVEILNLICFGVLAGHDWVLDDCVSTYFLED